MFFMRALYLLEERLGACNPGNPACFAALQHETASKVQLPTCYSKE
jgi:hypothetical protein